jgi:polyphosphate kinase
MQLYSLDLPQLKDRPFPLVYPSVFLDKKNIFETLRKQDVLVHHPYTAYSTVTEFVDQAADDPDVQAIKICLYRTGKDSPVVNSLIRASQNGKQVTALIELKARFDEENNIEWARRMENEGVHVVYGINTLKTHSKVLLVIRNEKNSLIRYVHLATGNYNPVTSRVYTDVGLMTSNPEFGADATNLFNFLTGYSQQNKFQQLLVAPINLREKFTQLVRREKKHAASKKRGRIIAKFNSLTDVGLIEELYSASQAGVEIDLIVRGVCMLRPGVPELSENIRVRSVIGRFLEHSRVFYFANGGKEGSDEVYIGSADWMSRNLDRRVEVAVPILDAEIKAFLRDVLLDAYLRDNVTARELLSDGTYKRVEQGKEPFDAQLFFVGIDITA